MRRHVVAGVMVLLCLSGDTALHAELTLVEDGRPTCVIVIADEASAAASQAAGDLQMWLRRSTGATVPIQRESEYSTTSGVCRVLIGDTTETRSLGIEAEELGLEEIVVQSFEEALVITGDDERPDGVPLRGTVLAVDVFVEDILGVRMLWPGRLGEIVPQQKSMAVADVNIRQQPVLLQRSVGNHAFNGAIHDNIDALGWDRDAYQEFCDETNLWFRFHRLGQSHTGSYSHAFGDYWERFHADHPDWFAQQPDGSRDNSQPADDGYPSHRLCVSNPGLIRQVADDVIERLRNRPTLDAASVTPNDGGLQTFCLCERCEAWDAREGETVEMRSKAGRVPHVSFSDRYVRFYSAVAELVAEELPERKIGALAYSVYTLAPVHAELHPNVVMGFVHGTKVYFDESKREQLRENWMRWSEKSDQLHVYTNGLMGLHALPTVIAHRLADDMRFYADHKMLFTYCDCNLHHWATSGLNYYVMVKLLWDPHCDVDAVIDDYCRVGFGSAAGSVRRYFDELEQISTAIAEERRRPDFDTVARHYTDETLQRLQAVLDEAERDAGDDEVVVERIEFLRTGLEYAPICRDYLVTQAATKGGNKWDWRRWTTATTRRIAFFERLGPTRVLHAPWLIYQDW